MSDTQPRIQTCQPIKSQMRRSLKKLPQNGEKQSQNWENSHNAIYGNFYKKKLLSPTQGLLSETLYFELVICFKGTLASLLLQSVS